MDEKEAGDQPSNSFQWANKTDAQQWGQILKRANGDLNLLRRGFESNLQGFSIFSALIMTVAIQSLFSGPESYEVDVSSGFNRIIYGAFLATTLTAAICSVMSVYLGIRSSQFVSRVTDDKLQEMMNNLLKYGDIATNYFHFYWALYTQIASIFLGTYLYHGNPIFLIVFPFGMVFAVLGLGFGNLFEYKFGQREAAYKLT